MRYKGFYLALFLEAVLCVIFALPQMQPSGMFTTVTAFPFEQIGWGLRRLSLSGTAGNAAAIALYLLLSLLPCAVFCFLWVRKKLCRADWLLAAMSVLLFIVNYYMINPGLLQTGVAGTGKWMLGSTFYAVFCGYLALRMLHMYSSADTGTLQKALKILLLFMMAAFVFVIFGQGIGDLLSAIQSVRNGNNMTLYEADLFGTAQDLTLTYVFLVFQFWVKTLPYGMDIVAAYFAVGMLDALAQDRYSNEAVCAVNRLADFCRTALTVTIGVEMVFHVLQLLVQKQLYKVDITIRFPVLSIVFVLAMLLAARYLQEDQRLKQDNDLFI